MSNHHPPHHLSFSSNWPSEIRSTDAGSCGTSSSRLLLCPSFCSLRPLVRKFDHSTFNVHQIKLLTHSTNESICLVFGYWTDALFTRPGTIEGNLHALVQLDIWIRTFYAVAVVQNILTTGLMVYAIYRNYRNTVGANVRR